MPLRHGLAGRGPTKMVYRSPFGLYEDSFENLSLTDRHYVHYYGRELRDTILCRREWTGEEVMRVHGVLSKDGVPLGRDTFRLAVYATLRWMHARGELRKLARGWERVTEPLTASPEAGGVAAEASGA